jgi:hypothetical protein
MEDEIRGLFEDGYSSAYIESKMYAKYNYIHSFHHIANLVNLIQYS